MAAITEYERRTTHSRNPLARFSHRARQEKAARLIYRHLPRSGALLDFGCAHGELLRRVREACPDARLYGLDPFAQPGDDYIHLRSPADCGGLTFDVIVAFEVLEHLSEGATADFLSVVRKHVARGGVCVVSAPIMVGPVLFAKLAHARLAGGSALHYSTRESLRAGLLLRNPPRLPPNRVGTLRHKGYDWRATRAMIGSEFQIAMETFTPFPWLWWGLNSQWFCVFRSRNAQTG